MVFLMVLSVVVGSVGYAVFRHKTRLGRYLLALLVAPGGWLMSAAVFEDWYNPPTTWAFTGAFAGAIATLAAPTGAWWFGAVPVVIVYGFGTLVGAVIWQYEGIRETVLIQFACAFVSGLATEAVRQFVVPAILRWRR